MAGDLKKILKESAPVLSVGIISADLMHLFEAVSELEACNIRLLHFDVMDGNFCPQLTIGPFFVKGISTNLYKDIHLMVSDPIGLIADFVKAGADAVTIQVESCRHVHRALQMISELKNVNDPSRKILRGIALTPSTPLSVIEPFVDETDIISLLAVNPGFPGAFIESTIRRAKDLRRILSDMNVDPLICIDGGINPDTISKASAAGADIIVSGSAVFRNGDIRGNINSLTEKIHKRNL